MKSAIRVLILVALAGCAAVTPGPPALDAYLPDEPIVDDFRFFHGGGPWPRFIYAFHLTESKINVARQGRPDPEVYTLEFDDCPELQNGLSNLKRAVEKDLRVAAGVDEPATTDVIVVDGPTYELEFYSREISGEVAFKGGDNAQLVSGWIDAALEVRGIAESCRD